MKKFIITICAFATILAVGCSKEVETSHKEYKLVVNMDKASFSDATRAPRNSWLDGDEVMLFFGADYQSQKWLTLLYNDNTWSIKDRADFDENAYITELASSEVKTLKAVYCSTPGDIAVGSYGDLGLSEPKDRGILIMASDDATYLIDNEQGTVTIDASLSPTIYEDSFVQFTVRGIDLKSWNDRDWKLRLVGSQVKSCLNFIFMVNEEYDINYLGLDTENVEDYSLMGYKYDEDGVSFFAAINGFVIGKETNFQFGLTDGECYYKKTFTDKTLQPNSAIIFNGPEQCEIGSESNGWTRTR